MAQVTVTSFGLVPGTDRDIYITWDWNAENTDHYEVEVWYALEGIPNRAFTAGETPATTKRKSYQYTAPVNATKVTISVRPISTTYKDRNVDRHHWYADWSTQKSWYFKNNPPVTPGAPTLELDGLKLTARLDGYPENANRYVVFAVQKELFGTYIPYRNQGGTMRSGSISVTLNVEPGSRYRANCRVRLQQSSRGSEQSEWSPWSNIVEAVPDAPTDITTIKATTPTSVYLEWGASATAKTYDIEFATKKAYLGTDKAEIASGIESTSYEKIGLASGSEYFFRVRAVNGQGQSGWTEHKSIIIGKAPSAPTTWSSTTTAVVGEPVTLYWTHNTEDNSRQRYAEIEIDTGSGPVVNQIDDTANDESEDDDDVTHYAISTSQYPDGTDFRWRVRTKGILDEWSEWSIQRTISIYAPATLSVGLMDENRIPISTVTSFPLRVYGVSGPANQETLGYHISIIADGTYQSTDHIGNPKTVNKGEVIYSRYFDVSGSLDILLNPGDVDLANNMQYTIRGTVSKASGLTAEDSDVFAVAWAEDIYEPNASIGIDTETYSAFIQPYCIDSRGKLVEDVTLAVYRREFDGKFTEIMSGMENTNDIYTTDPHPALDYARYRIVATSKTTGAVSYYDPPGYPVQCDSAILQWDEDWSNFEAVGDQITVERPWAGSMLQLRYNIDVSDKSQPDVALVKYIGREHPVGYYGTQLGQSSTWKMAIPRDDIETLYAIRRLSVWMGNVYVREPSGTGYWANVTVSYSQQHTELTIPITLEITRVEGGI